MLAVVDYGIGNTRSVLNAFEHIGASAMLTRDTEILSNASGLILPGVGAFGEGMRRLQKHGLREQLLDLVGNGKPVLGICLGFQMLMQSSTELGDHAGLGLIPLEVVHLPVAARLPHIGWSPVTTASDAPAPSQLLRGLEGERFYFVHSYGVMQPDAPVVAGLVTYENCCFLASIESDNVFGTQFHPEKSGEAGLQLLRNFWDLTR
jgi:glutamine amidotransferase